MTQNKQPDHTDSNSPLHLMQPGYPFPYRVPGPGEIENLLDRVFQFLRKATPARMIDAETRKPVTGTDQQEGDLSIEPGSFRLTSYEWGVLYAGMLLAAQVTGNRQYLLYTEERLRLIADLAAYYSRRKERHHQLPAEIRPVLFPESLDDAGTMCAAFIQAELEGLGTGFRSLINNYMDHIREKQYRLNNGTYARNRPSPDTLWLDDMYMSVSALSLMGRLTGQDSCLKEAVDQVLLFSKRMFNEKKRIYRHGWIQGVHQLPPFFWARANGWALMAKVALLDMIPPDDQESNKVLMQLQLHLKGLFEYQSGQGLWHQLLDHNDSYLETSASAMFVYGITRAINRGWVDPRAYGPAALLGWNALEAKVNDSGEITGTCVGTGMGFDKGFYFHRPVSVYAAHGYGPFFMAGSEILMLLKKYRFTLVENAIQVTLNDRPNHQP